jgi:deoxyribose-phosphate aldolase
MDTVETRVAAAQLPQLHEPRNPGMALDLDWVAAVQANTSAIERRAATLPGRRSVKKEYPGGLAPARDHLHRPHDAGGRRHAGTGPAALRQGGAAGAAGPARRARDGAADGGRGLRLSRHGGPGGRGAAGHRDPGGGRVDGISGRAVALPPARGRDRGEREGRRAGDRHRHLAAARADGELAGALRRDAGVPGGLRRGACEGDPRHRGTGHAAQRGEGEPRVHDGGGGLHQDLHRQGGRERDPAGEPDDDPGDPGLSRPDRVPGGLQARGRDLEGEGCAGVSLAHEGRAWDRWVRNDLFRFGASSLLGDIERQLEHHVTGRYSAGWRHAMA